MKILQMVNIDQDLAEQSVINTIQEICQKLKIDAVIDSEFCPGNYIQSQILFSFISIIGDSLGVTIPNECYIFMDKSRRPLSIKETVQKIRKEAKHEH